MARTNSRKNEGVLAARFMPARVVAEDRFYWIRVRDLVLMANIGVYEREHLGPQRVRINLDLLVGRIAGVLDDDIGKVVSYDKLIAGIREIIARGHVNLIETLADDIATLCMANPRIAHVRVGVDKLDIVPEAESVGVEIERTRDG